MQTCRMTRGGARLSIAGSIADLDERSVTYNFDAHIRTCDVNDNVTTHVVAIEPGLNGCVRLSSIIRLCSKCRGAFAIAAWTRQKTEIDV